jgi:cytoskeletal protein CcmA (bactofilin family)
MSFFRRETEESPQPGAVPRPAVPPPAAAARDRAVTRIAEGTRIQGEVTGGTELLIEGEVLGQIRLDSRVVVGAAGVVRGRVSARSVLVAGTVEGDVRGSERVEVGASGRLQGDIAAPRVTIAEGAFFKGQVEMTGRATGERRAEAASPSPAAPPSPPPPGTPAAVREPPEAPGLFPEHRPGGPPGTGRGGERS